MVRTKNEPLRQTPPAAVPLSDQIPTSPSSSTSSTTACSSQSTTQPAVELQSSARAIGRVTVTAIAILHNQRTVDPNKPMSSTFDILLYTDDPHPESNAISIMQVFDEGGKQYTDSTICFIRANVAKIPNDDTLIPHLTTGLIPSHYMLIGDLKEIIVVGQDTDPAQFPTIHIIGYISAFNTAERSFKITTSPYVNYLKVCDSCSTGVGRFDAQCVFPNSKRWNKLPRIQLGQPVAVTGSLIGLERDSSFYPDYFTVLVDDWTPQDAQMTLSQPKTKVTGKSSSKMPFYNYTSSPRSKAGMIR